MFDLPDWFRQIVDSLKTDLKWYASKPDPKTRKGGFGSRSKAITQVRADSTAGPKVWKTALKELGWK